VRDAYSPLMLDLMPVVGKLLGYARVSSVDQDLTVQREVLRNAGAQVIFEEKVSGTERDNRDELAKVLHILGKG